MDKATERARAWQRYRRERKPFAYVEPGLEGCFNAGYDAGLKIGLKAGWEAVQAALLADEERAS